MAAKSPQTHANHARFDPAFHFFVLPVLLINLLSSAGHAYQNPNLSSFWLVILSLALLVLAFKARLYALKVQDRVIRMEERLRINAIVPATLRTGAGELSERQLIALRFAPDEELADLVQKTSREGLTKDQIKKAIVNWRADDFRV